MFILFFHALFALTPLCALSRDEIFSAMRRETSRAASELRLEDYPRPYFISLRLTEENSKQVDLREGAVVFSSEETGTRFIPEVRVGAYTFDQSPDTWRGASASEPLVTGADSKVLRHYLWAALDEAYKEACGLYFFKKAKRSSEGEPEYATVDFSKESPKIYGESPALFKSIESYEETLARTSKVLGGDPEVLRSLVRWSFRERKIHFMNSEGAEIFSAQNLASVYLSLYGRSLKGLPLHLTRVFYAAKPEDLPSEEQLNQASLLLKKSYFELYRSSEAQGGLAPCILDPQAAGQLFTAFSQRLEGERQRDPNEPKTFSSKLGEKVLPAFLTLVDDPALGAFQGISLLGSYPFDEEGISPRAVTLIEKGVLKDFLLSRRPVKGMPPQSNGHGRAEAGLSVHGRMGNLIVSSSRELPREKLRSELLALLKKRSLPFGFMVEGLEMSQQDSGTGAHQTFRGAPQRLTLLYPDGREVLVHQGEVVGTPMKLMQSIMATGDDYKVASFLASGASGSVPVSVVSPSLLIEEIELQKGSARPMRQPILESPFKE